MYKINPKIKNVMIDYGRMDNEECRMKLNSDGHYEMNYGDYGVTAVGYHKSMELLAMACEDIVPNGSYSDYELQIWEMYRMVLRKEGMLS